MVRSMALALTVLCLHFAVCAQTDGSRDREKPPTQSSSVGTNAPVGGPTGLFTIYDGSTIRRGEFTFSIAYSNFDRDPGNADNSDVPISFNVGLNDHVELFFKTNGYRDSRVGNPENLSSFYLPSSQVHLPATALCGPACNVGGHPFRRFAFIGASFYRKGGFGTASNFPGIGLPVGGVFPGIVLARRTITPNFTFKTLVVPDVLSIAPDVPDALFVNPLYGESSFHYRVLGENVSLIAPNDAFGPGFVLLYRYLDKDNDLSGLTYIQRGAGPGNDTGDVGMFMFPDQRLSEHVKFSANLSYILNSPQSDAIVRAVRLSKLDEVRAGFFNLPVNQYGQAIAEVRSAMYVGGQGMYVGGQTLSDFTNLPLETLDRARVFPWSEIGNVYSGRLVQADVSNFKKEPESETASEYFGTAFYEGSHALSSSAFPLSQNIYEARTWNRSSYSAMNNPLGHLTLGLFIWHPDVSVEDRQKIRLTLKRGPEDVKKICALHGPGSFQCKKFKRAIDALGAEGINNGVILAVGPVQTEGAAAETSVASCREWTRRTKDNPTGQRTTVTLTQEAVNSDGLIHMIRHEGSHVADGWKWRKSGCKESRNPFLYDTEFTAYIVSSLSAEVYKPNFGYGIFLQGGGRPGKNPYLPERVPIYLPGLKPEDLEILRVDNTNKLLERPKDAGGLYGVTPESRGNRVFRTGKMPQ